MLLLLRCTAAAAAGEAAPTLRYVGCRICLRGAAACAAVRCCAQVLLVSVRAEVTLQDTQHSMKGLGVSACLLACIPARVLLLSQHRVRSTEQIVLVSGDGHAAPPQRSNTKRGKCAGLPQPNKTTHRVEQSDKTLKNLDRH
jgi:hypothetical protein